MGTEVFRNEKTNRRIEVEKKIKLTDIRYVAHLYKLARSPQFPMSIEKLLTPVLKNYIKADEDHQNLVVMTKWLTGKTPKLVFQMSNGTQQIKLYEPEKYRNNRITPLRFRSRKIVQLASQYPHEKLNDKVKELHRTYPYYLLKLECVNLRLLNFHFKRQVREGDELKIYRKISEGEPDPQTDMLIKTIDYKPKKSVKFEYEGQEEEHYYAVHVLNGNLSNILHFIWLDELPQL